MGATIVELSKERDAIVAELKRVRELEASRRGQELHEAHAKVTELASQVPSQRAWPTKRSVHQVQVSLSKG